MYTYCIQYLPTYLPRVTSIAAKRVMAETRLRAVFLDLDGTTLNSRHEITERTEQILRLLSSKGIIVGIATGRSSANITKYLLQLKLAQEKVPVVCYNGAIGFYYTTRNEHEVHQETIFSKPLTEQCARELIAFAGNHGCVLQVSYCCISHMNYVVLYFVKMLPSYASLYS